MSQDNYVQLERRAESIYSLIFDAVGGNWSYSILGEADKARDNFEFQRQGYIQMSQGEVIDQFHSFIERCHNLDLRRGLAPILFNIPKD